jgi:DNA-binding transcriptional MerR regulator
LRLKKLYSSREVAAMTGLSARQLQWWHARRLFVPSIPPQKTDAGGYTERRYTPVDLLELMVLADLRRRGLSIATIRRLLDTLRTRFNVRLFEAIEGGGPVTLFIDGQQIFARSGNGDLYNVLDNPGQPLLMVGEDLKLRQLVAKEGKSTRKTRRARTTRKKPDQGASS